VSVSDARRLAGIHPVLETLRRGLPVHRLLVARGRTGAGVREILGLAEQRRIPVDRLARRDLDRLAPASPHQGVVAELPPFPYASLDEVVDRVQAAGDRALVVAADRLADPRNLGALLRVSAAFSADAVLICRHEAAGVTPAAERAAAGTATALPVARVTNLARALDRLGEAGLWVAGACAEGGAPPATADLALPLCLVVGSESRGLRPGVARRCDLRLQIPLPGGVESLNVATAAAVLLYEVSRQRGP